MMKTAALVVLSGGQDSTTCLFIAKQEYDVIHAITFDYGQRHRIEIDAARKVAELAGVTTHEIIPVPNCLRSASPLTSNNELEQYENAEQMEKVIGNRVELTFVPMRNTLFLTIAVNRAVALGLRDIFTGICQEDNANYPDCREDFRWRFESMVNASLDSNRNAGICIHAPLMYKTKQQTVHLAKKLPGCWEALAYSHTSYDGKYPPTDMNHANVLRAQGFKSAGLADPLVARAWHEGLMELPDTENYDALRMFSRRGDGGY
jgi:7-cyano-7-deazaguanine synthase